MKQDAENAMNEDNIIDPTCLFHGKKWSEHKYGRCIYCPLCFRSDEYEHWVDAEGQKWDICVGCKKYEDSMMGKND